MCVCIYIYNQEQRDHRQLPLVQERILKKNSSDINLYIYTHMKLFVWFIFALICIYTCIYIYIHIYSHLVAIVFYVYTELIVFYVYKSIGFIVNIQILIHISIYIYIYSIRTRVEADAESSSFSRHLTYKQLKVDGTTDQIWYINNNKNMRFSFDCRTIYIYIYSTQFSRNFLYF